MRVMNLEDELRPAFEKWISSPPFEMDIERYPDTEDYAWPGRYVDIDVDLAFLAYVEAWKQHDIEDASQPQKNEYYANKYVALYKAGGEIAVCTHLLNETIPPPHPSHFVGCFPVTVPKWVFEESSQSPWDKPHPLEICE